MNENEHNFKDGCPSIIITTVDTALKSSEESPKAAQGSIPCNHKQCTSKLFKI